jgi:hypothetical protein
MASFYLAARPVDFTLPKDYRRMPGEPPLNYSPALLFGLRLASYRRDVALQLEPDVANSELVRIASGQPAEDLAGRVRSMLMVRLEEQQSWTGQYDALKWS